MNFKHVHLKSRLNIIITVFFNSKFIKYRRERILSEVLNMEYTMWISSIPRECKYRIDQIRLEGELKTKELILSMYDEMDEDLCLDESIDFQL